MSGPAFYVPIARRYLHSELPFGDTKAHWTIRERIDPHNMMLPKPSELKEDSTFADIKLHMWFIRASFECHPQIDPREANDEPFQPLVNGQRRLSNWIFMDDPIAFLNGQEKTNWSGKKDMERFQVFNYFFKKQMDNDNVQWQNEQGWCTRIALFVTKSNSWVGGQNDDIILHAFVCSLEPIRGEAQQRHGFRLLVHDPNIQIPGAGPHGVAQKANKAPFKTIRLIELFGMIQRFVEFTESKKRRIHEIWIYGSRNGNPHGRCLAHCSEFLQWYLPQWGQWPRSREYLQHHGWIEVIRSQAGLKTLALPGEKRRLSPNWERPETRSHSGSRSNRSESPATSLAYERRGRKLLQRKSQLQLETKESECSDLSPSQLEIDTQLSTQMATTIETPNSEITAIWDEAIDKEMLDKSTLARAQADTSINDTYESNDKSDSERPSTAEFMEQEEQRFREQEALGIGSFFWH